MYDNHNMYSNHIGGNTQFNDPWSQPTSSQSDRLSMPYSHIPTSAPMSSGIYYPDNTSTSGDVLSSLQDIPRSYDHQYSAPTTTASTYATAYPSSLSYAQSLHQQQQQQHQQRKLAEPVDTRSTMANFNELDASRGMLALSHQNVQDLTPRNIFEARAQRTSGEVAGYGFPTPVSNHSSISAESGRSYGYYNGSSGASVTDSATEYSSAASDAGYEPMQMSRTLPRPQQMMSTGLNVPAPQSMMGQFSSKMSSNTQKKHKCKVCDKRFTRPSSLQTHMYSHTGEKPFACDVEGCGRHFSVVSNLRRHKKVHRGESVSSHSDCED